MSLWNRVSKVKVYLLVQPVQCVKIIGFALPTDFSISSESFVELAKRQGDLFRILRGAYRLCLPEGYIQAILMSNFSCKYIFREIAIKDKKFLSESTKKQALKNTRAFLECYIFGERRDSLYRLILSKQFLRLATHILIFHALLGMVSGSFF